MREGDPVRVRPEDQERIPDLYEVVKVDDEGIRWTGARFKANALAEMQRVIQPPYIIAPITFTDKIKGV